MKIRFMSDLHLEFDDKERRDRVKFGKEFARFEIPEQEDDAETTLILAGDCHVGHGLTDYLAPPHYEYPAWIHRFKRVIYIPGNHEYYGRTMQQLDAWWAGACEWEDNLYWCPRGDGFIFEEDDKKIGLFCGTMWTDFNDGDITAMDNARWMISDFGQIGWLENYGTEEEHRHFYGPIKAHALYWEFATRLRNFKAQNLGLDALVVATHFAPTHAVQHETWARTSSLFLR